jgi:hypothetical protein
MRAWPTSSPSSSSTPTQILAETGHLRQQATSRLQRRHGFGKSFDAFQKNLFSGHYGGRSTTRFKFKVRRRWRRARYRRAKRGKTRRPKTLLFRSWNRSWRRRRPRGKRSKSRRARCTNSRFRSEADFWDKALKRTDLSAKDRFEITKKWISAEQALQKDRVSKVLDEDKREIFEADKNAQLKLAIVKKEAAFVKQMYGEDSKEARAANMAVLQADREATNQRIALTKELIQARKEAAADQVSEAERAAQFDEEMGRVSKGKLLQEERQFQNQMYQIDLQALQREKALIDPLHDPVAFQKINLQIEQLERQHQQKLTQIDRQATLQRTQVARTAIQQTSQAWGQAVGQFMTGQITLHDALIQSWQGMVQAIGNAISSIVENWIQQQLTALILGRAHSMAAGASEIGTNAAVAASGAYAATAAIPYVGPELAPAAAATAYAGAISWIGAVSAEGGDYNVREGLYHLHENEMVLPAWAASPLRGMIESSQSPSFMLAHADATKAPAGGGGGGDSHFNYQPTINHHDASWDRMIQRDSRDARRWFKSEWRAGRLTPPER